MPTRIAPRIPEKGSAVFTVSFYDEDSLAVTPNAGLAWTLTDRAGNVVNSRSGVALTPAASVVIKLHGNDLALAGYNGRERHLTVTGTYASGADTLEIKDEAVFLIDDLIAV